MTAEETKKQIAQLLNLWFWKSKEDSENEINLAENDLTIYAEQLKQVRELLLTLNN